MKVYFDVDTKSFIILLISFYGSSKKELILSEVLTENSWGKLLPLKLFHGIITLVILFFSC